jgi:hypothetical protein
MSNGEKFQEKCLQEGDFLRESNVEAMSEGIKCS